MQKILFSILSNNTMTQTIIWTIVIITVLGSLLAVILYFVAEKFKVEEDPRIDEVEELLPGANCGGCGFAGCRAFCPLSVCRQLVLTKFIAQLVGMI